MVWCVIGTVVLELMVALLRHTTAGSAEKGGNQNQVRKRFEKHGVPLLSVIKYWITR
jgi:hypothetical protein